MGSTVCVKCGANLVPNSYCDICHDVISFTCSSCSMDTVERIHAYSHNNFTLNNNNNLHLQDSQMSLKEPISPRFAINDNYINTHIYIQNQLNDKIKENSIKLSTSYWNNMFEAIQLVNAYWGRIINIGNASQNTS
jgi:hypothetical protein